MNTTKQAPAYKVVRNARCWDIVDSAGNLVEGGFFYRDAALDALAEWRGELTPSSGPTLPKVEG